jgi:hypothetical protein
VAGADGWSRAALLAGARGRHWLARLPEPFRAAAARPYAAAEVAEARRRCNAGAPPAAGRPPKLIFQLGAPGTGKSSRLAECYDLLGVAGGAAVEVDGPSLDSRL